MTPEELKYSILKLAFSGRLVPQIEQEIVNCKKAFCVDEAPFDVPEKWKWNYIGNICEMYTGDSIAENIKKSKYEGLKEGFDYIGTKDVSFDHEITYDNGVRIPFENDFKRAYPDCILMCIEGGSAGRKIAILDREVCFGNKLCMLKAQTIFNKYLYYYLQSAEFKSIFKDNLSGIIGGVSIKKIKGILIPIPPLEEQKRIVEKIEELLPLVDRYEEAWSKLEKFNKKFPVDVEKSILELAVKGKLVEQKLGEDASLEYKFIMSQKENFFKKSKAKKGLEVKTISDDDLPFDIPNTWKWIRLGELASVISKGTTPRGGNVAYLESGIGFLRAENVAGFDQLDKSSLKYIDEETHTGYLSRSILEANDILVTIAGTLGRTGLVRSEDLPLNANQAVSFVRLSNTNSVDLEYIIYSLNTPSVQKVLAGQTKTTAIPNLTLEIIRDCLIPLPPFEEQKRIVTKLKELLPLCRKLIK